MNKPDYDVVILGGGLAGGLLVRQLRLQRPDLSVLCLERSTATAFKVGEATVELFTNYMLRKLGLSTYLYEHQLPKNGLRFFFDNEEKAAEAPLIAWAKLKPGETASKTSSSVLAVPFWFGTGTHDVPTCVLKVPV